jgi:drug/metabolite transporter (DMT)-like permease
MLRWWTIGRATGVGVTAGLAALILWPLYAAWQERVFWVFVVSLGVAAACGLSLLLISLADAVLKPRGRSLRPIRAFDVALGLLLAVPSLLQLEAMFA